MEKKLDPRPACSLESKDACKPEDRVILEESEKMSKAERAQKIKEVQQEIQDKDFHFCFYVNIYLYIYLFIHIYIYLYIYT